MPPPGYLAGVRDLCRAKGALFICDEVITGFRVGLRGALAPSGRRHGLLQGGEQASLVGGLADAWFRCVG